MDEIARLQAMWAHFVAIGDRGMAAEVEFQLERKGVTQPDAKSDDAPTMERAVSHTPPVKRGKQR